MIKTVPAPVSIEDADFQEVETTGRDLVVLSQTASVVPVALMLDNLTLLREAAITAAPHLLEVAEAHRAKIKSGEKKAQGGIKDIALKKRDQFRVSLFDLSIEDGWNSRDLDNADNIAHIEWLSENIAENGVIDAMEVVYKDDRLVITDGHCRYFAAMLAISRGKGQNLATVPVQTPEAAFDEEERVLSQILRNSGKRLNPLETAVALKKLLRKGLTEEMIATKISQSVAYVTARLKMLEAPEEIRGWVAAGKIAPSTAQEALNAAGSAKEAVRILGREVAKVDGVSVKKVTPKMIRAATGTLSHAKWRKEAVSVFKGVRASRDPHTKQVMIVLDDETLERIKALGIEVDIA